MRNRIWHNLANVKFKALYTNKCSNLAGSVGRAYSFFLAFASASSVAAWALWKQCPDLWALIVAFGQLLHIAKPYVPFIKNETEFLELSFEFEALYLEYERLWYDCENGRVNEDGADDVFYALREKESQIERSHKQVQCPRVQRLLDRAQTETETALQLNFS